MYKRISESLPSLKLYHCHFSLYIQKLRHLFLVLKASKSRQNGKELECAIKDECDSMHNLLGTQEREGKLAPRILKDVFLHPTVVFSDPFLECG